MISLTHAPVFTTDESIRYATALDLLTRVDSGIRIIAWFAFRRTFIQGAIEGFHLSCPELEGTGAGGGVATEGHLRWPVGTNLVDNLAIYRIIDSVHARV